METNKHIAHFEITLLQDVPMPLNLWYGEPLTRYQTEQLTLFSRQKQKQALFNGDECLSFQLKEMIARFFMNRDINIEYSNLVKTTREDKKIALIELVFGQLLMSKKIDTAMLHLDKGFQIAQKYLNATDYFSILKRHELLGVLKLDNKPSEPKSLSSLLVEASIIKQFETRNGSGKSYTGNPHDTLG